ncbi:MAG: LysR family transcriptional regulator [Pirellulaceae bacterium]
MDLAQLRYFMTVADCGSFTVAAKKCNVSQPALSQQIAKLEKEFGSTLFDRQGRQVTLTRMGHKLRERAASILEMVDETLKQMYDNGRFGSLVFAVSNSVGPYLTARILQHLGREFQEAELIFVQKSVPEILDGCVKGEVDLALIPTPTTASREVSIEPVFVEEIKVGVSNNHRLADSANVSIDQFEQELLVMFDEDSETEVGIRAAFDQSGIRPITSSQVGCYVLMNYLVSLERGIGLFPSTTIPRQANKNTCFLPIAGVPLKRTLSLCWNEKRYQTQLMTHFVKSIHEFTHNDLQKYESPSSADLSSNEVGESTWKAVTS